MIHRLASYRDNEWNLISKFVCKEIGRKCSVENIDNFLKAHSDEMVGRSRGNLFELRFIALLKSSSQVDIFNGIIIRCMILIQ